MFLKSLKIESNQGTIREISFHKGVNLIVDETLSKDRKKSGNNVGKTTVLKLIDYCLGGNGNNIYQDPEFKNKPNNLVKEFLQENNNNVIVTLELSKIPNSITTDILIRKNFLKRNNKVHEINGELFNNEKEFNAKLNELIFDWNYPKPSFRQLISKNIRYEKNRLTNILKVLHSTTTKSEYEALFLFWFNVNLDDADKKQKLLQQQRIELNLQSQLKKDASPSQIKQSLIVINRKIAELSNNKSQFNLNNDYSADRQRLSELKSKISRVSTSLSRFELRKDLILESKEELEKEFSVVNTDEIKSLYEEVSSFIPEIQVTFEDTLDFHNKMISQKVEFITKEIPELETKIKELDAKLNNYLKEQSELIQKLERTGSWEKYQQLVNELHEAHETKGALEEQQRIWSSSNIRLGKIKKEIEEINENIRSKDELLQSKITDFNKSFSRISHELYGEELVLSADYEDNIYNLTISSVSRNPGTGKKIGHMAAFDLAYIEFAEKNNISCVNFILQDQIENIHDNQISSIFTNVVNEINCQYILPVLQDKLPEDLDAKQYEVLSLSQNNKLFKL